MPLLKNTKALSTSLLPILIGVDAILLIAHTIVSLIGTFSGSRLFDLDGEQTIGAWWSGSQLLLAGALVGLAARSLADRSPPSRLFFWFLAMGLVFLSLDEVTSIHEGLTSLSYKYAGWIPSFKGNHGAWISIYAVIAIALLAMTHKDIKFLWLECRLPSALVFAGFFLLVIGAVGIEVVGGYYGLIRPPALQVGLEEFLEMVGGSVILFGTLVFFEQVQN